MKFDHKILNSLKVIILALVLSFGVQYVLAVNTWTAPSANPPAGNTEAPINTGTASQAKAGNLFIGAGNTDPTVLSLWVPFGRVGIGYGSLNSAAALDIDGYTYASGGLKVLTEMKTLPAAGITGKVLTASNDNGLTVWQSLAATGSIGGSVGCAAQANIDPGLPVGKVIRTVTITPVHTDDGDHHPVVFNGTLATVSADGRKFSTPNLCVGSGANQIHAAIWQVSY